MSIKVRVIDGQPVLYSFQRLRAENPLIQFPQDPPASLLAQFDMYDLRNADDPYYDPATQRIEIGDIEPDGEDFVQRWEVVELSTEEQAAKLIDLRQDMSVPRLAARLALIDEGLWDSIPALIAAIPDATAKARSLAYFEDAVTWRRLDSTVVTLATGLGLDDDDLDDLFVAAKVIDESIA